MARILVTRQLPDGGLDPLVAAGHEIVQRADDTPFTPEELRAAVADVDAVICLLTDRIDVALLDAAAAGGRVKVVATVAVGYDNIDVPAARQRNIIVTNTPDVLTEATAELTWALILGIARRVTEGDRLIRAGAWNRWALDFMLGMELRGKQLGIIGRGRIGRAVAAKAPAFGMRAVFAKHDMSLDELLVTSDVVSIHAPSTPETRHLINKRTLARMKRSAILVNTARGALVDEEALAWALSEHLIAGAALDVYEREPASQPALQGFENVLLCPHLGSATRETRTAMADLAARNVLAVLNGEKPLTPVT
jgi:glyoxylate reductase